MNNIRINPVIVKPNPDFYVTFTLVHKLLKERVDRAAFELELTRTIDYDTLKEDFVVTFLALMYTRIASPYLTNVSVSEARIDNMYFRDLDRANTKGDLFLRNNTSVTAIKCVDSTAFYTPEYVEIHAKFVTSNTEFTLSYNSKRPEDRREFDLTQDIDIDYKDVTFPHLVLR